MVFAEPLLFLYDSDETGSSARLSFSSEFLDESNFITIFPNPKAEREEARRARAAVDFEFLSGNLTGIIAADELFSEGKLLPFQQIHLAEKLDRISLKPEEEARKKDQERRMSWFVDDDPSPRPPKCTVLWKELLKLKKPRPSTLSTPNSSSSSISSSSSSFRTSSVVEVREEVVKESGESSKRVKKGKERTRSFSIRIRPVLNVPICTQAKNAALPPLFSSRKGR
ncbi:uncharacterized protein LOC125197421 [Salvia hispanica]|uniref:uncharacterized protein LOC125194596 n=1 Tax=Salvia hispanica TaxID=49212 RepID=UPI00200951E4|nr:uncharacterized protein LOC125194596 [Salvia hispanica]XP_047952115.1 uncharacterized protein LOC125197421 [Salvia hispanica]